MSWLDWLDTFNLRMAYERSRTTSANGASIVQHPPLRVHREAIPVCTPSGPLSASVDHLPTGPGQIGSIVQKRRRSAACASPPSVREAVANGGKAASRPSSRELGMLLTGRSLARVEWPCRSGPLYARLEKALQGSK